MLPDGRGGWNCVNVDDVPAPQARGHVIEDTMSPLEHPCDGRVYESKHEFSAVTRAHGCVEVGEAPGDRRERAMNFRPRRDELWSAFSQAYDDIKAGRGPKWQR
jgi:hypothetical protein